VVLISNKKSEEAKIDLSSISNIIPSANKGGAANGKIL
jgi:hypothetical protein